MKQIFTRKILSRVLILCFMIAGAVYITAFDTQKVLAAPCCQECDTSYSDCDAGCGGNQSCMQACVQQYHSCLRHCIMCDNGPACGEGSNWDAWCQSWGYSTCSGGYCVY